MAKTKKKAVAKKKSLKTKKSSPRPRAQKKKITVKKPKVQSFEEAISEQKSVRNEDALISESPAAPIIAKKPRRYLPWLISGVIMLCGVAIATYFISRPPRIVPSAVSESVSFPVYYPEQAKLPQGYRLDTNSFSNPIKQGVAYKVEYGQDKQIVFSVQAKPSDNELQSFASNYIPLKIEFQTPLGQAALGAYNSQTLVSLPIIDGPWVVITAPADVNQAHLKQVVRSLKRP